METKGKFVAVDSNVLRILAFMNKRYEEFDNGKFVFEKSKDCLIQKYGKYFLDILRHMKNENEKERLNILILDYVYMENKHIPLVNEFIKNNCYVSKKFLAGEEKYRARVNHLARAYCKPYKKKMKDELRPAPMQSVYNAYANKDIPSNDAYIMAQATLEGVLLVTANGKDFTFNIRNQDNTDEEYVNDRTEGIVDINMMLGYCEKSDKGDYYVVPKAMRVKQFGELLKKGMKKFAMPSDNVRYELASEPKNAELIDNGGIRK